MELTKESILSYKLSIDENKENIIHKLVKYNNFELYDYLKSLLSEGQIYILILQKDKNGISPFQLSKNLNYNSFINDFKRIIKKKPSLQGGYKRLNKKIIGNRYL